MIWKEFGSSLKKETLYKKRLIGIEILLENKLYEISISGIYSIKKRRLISQDQIKQVYKITIEDLREDISFLGIQTVSNKTFLFPIIRSKGILSEKIKKIYVDRKKQRVEFLIDENGKIIG